MEKSPLSQEPQWQDMQLGTLPVPRSQSVPKPFFGYSYAIHTQTESRKNCERQNVERGQDKPQDTLPSTLPWGPSAQPSQTVLAAVPPCPSACPISQERIDQEQKHVTGESPISVSVLSSDRRPHENLRANSFLPVQRKVLPTSNERTMVSQGASHHSSTRIGRLVHPNATGQEITATDEGENNCEGSCSRCEQTQALVSRVRKDVANLTTLLSENRRRIDSMENVSFPHTDDSDTCGKLQERQEELEEKIESMEIRQAEIDGRIIELEKFHDDNSTILSSFASSRRIADPSFIISLETRIAELEAQIQAIVPPTADRSWEVEVVFLPFGSSLRGIWSKKEDLQISHTTDDKSGTHIRLSARERLESWERVAKNDGRDFLVARSCNRKSKVYARLKSRGYVRTVQIRGPAAKDVDAALVGAFGDSLERMSTGENRLNRTYRALNSLWIPLRKLHKDSCLRFLDPHEMISQTMWNVEFLRSSVIMRGTGLRTFFVTHSHGYTQDSTKEGWTWPQLQHRAYFLPRINVDSDETGVEASDAHEDCWELDERYDLLPVQNSQAYGHSQALSIRPAPPLEIRKSTSRPARNDSPAALTFGVPTPPERVTTPIADIHNPRGKRRSLHGPLQEISSLSKRKMPHFSRASLRSSPTHVPAHVTQKRRRTRSPSAPRRRNTSRYSSRPRDLQDNVFEVNCLTGTTPLPYMTPHSLDCHHIPRYDDDDDEGHRDSEFDPDSRGACPDHDGEDDEDDDKGYRNIDEPANEREGTFKGTPLNHSWESLQYAGNDEGGGSESSSSAPPPEHPKNRNELPPSTPCGFGRNGRAFSLHVDDDDRY